MSLFHFFLRRTFLVNVLTGFIIIIGLVALFSMKRDLHPPFEWNRINIDVSLLGASAEEMEKFVTYPIEDAIRGLAGVEEMTSKSEPGRSKITLSYNAGKKDMLVSVEEVRTRVESIRAALPNEIRYINVSQIRDDRAFLFNIGFQGIDILNEKHRQFYNDFEKEVLNVPGIVRVYKSMPRRDIYIEYNPKFLSYHEISAAQVNELVREALRISPVGQTVVNDDVYGVEVSKTASTTAELQALVLRSNLSGNNLLLKDVAKVSYKLEDQFEENFLNGSPMAGMWIIKDTLSDAIELKYKVTAIVDRYNEKAPEGVQLVKVSDGPRFIEQQIEVLLANGLTGFVLVFLILLLFLNGSSALLTALGLPMAYLATFVCLFALGIKIDLLSIVGLILVVGLLVDDAIIITERYNEFLSQGHPPMKAASLAIGDMVVPVTGGILTSVVAFMPMLLIQSEISNVLWAIPVVVIASLLFSWLECFFILPNHLMHFSSAAPSPRRARIIERLRKGYESVLSVCLKFRYGIVILLLVMTGTAGYLATQKLQQDFNMNIGREQVSIYGALKQSDSVKESVAKMKPLEDYLRSFPKEQIENVGLYVGSIWMDGAMRQGKRYVKLIAHINSNEKYPRRTLNKIKEKVAKKIESLDSENFERLFVNIDRKQSEELKKQMVQVRIKGNDSVDIGVIREDVIQTVSSLEEITEHVPDPNLEQMSWVFEPRRDRLMQYGLNSFGLSQQLRSFFTANEVMETRLNGEKVYIYTEAKGRRDLQFSELQDFTVLASNGSPVPLKLLGQWKERGQLKTIRHEDGLRSLRLDFRINEEKANKSAAQKTINEALAQLSDKYPSFKLGTRNTNEEEEKNQSWGLKVALVCILSVLLVMSLTLGSVVQPLIVGLPIPFGLIGIIFALYLHNLPLGLMSIIGLIGTVGISVNASIILMDQINKLKKLNGVMDKFTLIEACSERLRAITLTTLTTLGGLLPMAYSLGGESGFTQPLAFSMAWGLVFATVLTLFALPALLLVTVDIGNVFRRLRKRPSAVDEVVYESERQVAQPREL